MAKFLGNVKVKVNGQLVKTVGDSVELGMGGYARESNMADDTFNFNEKPASSKLSFSILHTNKTDVKALNELESGTVEVITDIGKSYTQTSATRMGDPITSSSSDGTIKVEIEGDPIVP